MIYIVQETSVFQVFCAFGIMWNTHEYMIRIKKSKTKQTNNGTIKQWEWMETLRKVQDTGLNLGLWEALYLKQAVVQLITVARIQSDKKSFA